MRTSLLAGLTTRGTSFLAGGAAAAITGYALSQRSLFCVGIALLALPLLATVAARRSQFRLATTRAISPARVQAGHTAIVTLRVANVSRLPTGLLLAEDTVPYALGARPRFVLDRIERGGTRDLSYSLRSDVRGKFEIGPLALRVADSFGLVELGRQLTGRNTLIVTPQIVPLVRTAVSRSWAGEGEGLARLTSTAGEDDVIPRAYRDGDELRRVHWRSTARYGELMVRREEQRWRNSAAIFLDTRSLAHTGGSSPSSFEAAVSAAASVGVHLVEQGLTGHFMSEAEAVGGGPFFEDRLLEVLATIKPSPSRILTTAVTRLRALRPGVVIAIMGRITIAEAEQLAACRADGSQGVALLLDVATFSAASGTRPAHQPAPGTAGNAAGSGADRPGTAQPPSSAAGSQLSGPLGHPSDRSSAETRAAAKVLQSAGWHAAVLDAATPLSIAWQRLPWAAGILRPSDGGAAMSWSGQPGAAAANAAGPAAAGSAPGDAAGRLS